MSALRSVVASTDAPLVEVPALWSGAVGAEEAVVLVAAALDAVEPVEPAVVGPAVADAPHAARVRTVAASRVAVRKTGLGITGSPPRGR
jgi:hypothetical protein